MCLRTEKKTPETFFRLILSEKNIDSPSCFSLPEKLGKQIKVVTRSFGLTD